VGKSTGWGGREEESNKKEGGERKMVEVKWSGEMAESTCVGRVKEKPTTTLVPFFSVMPLNLLLIL
jgi:hypothetical protein